MLRRSEERIEEEDVEVLRSGKIFRLSGAKRTATNREGECSSTEGSDYDSILPDETKLWEIETTTTQYQSDEDSSQAEHCVGPTNPSTTWNKEVRPENLLQTSFQTSEKNIKISLSQNSGIGTIVVSQTIPGGTAPRRMADDLRILIFNGNGSQDPKQHIFVCEAIWTAKKLHD